MNSFIGWIGGKKLLRKEIVKRFPTSFNRYIEVFGGAAWVLFYQDKHADLEILNDKNGDLINLYRCAKHHRPELQRELSCMLNSRELFDDFKAQYNIRGFTDIQRAARYFMIVKTSYGSNTRNFGCVKKDISTMKVYLEKIEERLSKVLIENKDFEGLLKIYDKPDAFSFLDPPYADAEEYYKDEFIKDDHLRLYQVLQNIKGKFLLTYNDCDFIRSLYKDYKIDEVSRNHNLVGRYSNQSHMYKELIITNY